ncbi:uncharacterized protein MYCFIDRAFT_205630 [Pseudocercospora fijiensis CIRAD86]|uniref:Uncharacterized protein n=1 Tax=Pseudocercospora fijiensis (strain CIRAD86) TaxID=383855 RepID=N1Q8U6_PSEFD|nr:uncharacterized protein MYCFIDRAFT_205630 [Pseudocercospora fijiensis CIRAD86]EME87308.1 hypothetical protein MYCFIDRAFT_205630 [Pseudocercospora fijiensis CIRAD86]
MYLTVLDLDACLVFANGSADSGNMKVKCLEGPALKELFAILADAANTSGVRTRYFRVDARSSPSNGRIGHNRCSHKGHVCSYAINFGKG